MKTFLILLLILFPLMVLADDTEKDKPIQLAKADLFLLGVGKGSGVGSCPTCILQESGAVDYLLQETGGVNRLLQE